MAVTAEALGQPFELGGTEAVELVGSVTSEVVGTEATGGVVDGWLACGWEVDPHAVTAMATTRAPVAAYGPTNFTTTEDRSAVGVTTRHDQDR